MINKKKLISHRGNLTQPFPEKENNPIYIDQALSKGYDVEIDLRYINNKYYLGQDTPDYEIDTKWIKDRSDRIWIHCKDPSSVSVLYGLKSNIPELKYFCHNVDPFVLVSNGLIWAHFDILSTDMINLLDKNFILPLLTEDLLHKFSELDVFGICSDFVENLDS
jgi:hypothetical protein